MDKTSYPNFCYKAFNPVDVNLKNLLIRRWSPAIYETLQLILNELKV